MFNCCPRARYRQQLVVPAGGHPPAHFSSTPALAWRTFHVPAVRRALGMRGVGVRFGGWEWLGRRVGIRGLRACCNWDHDHGRELDGHQSVAWRWCWVARGVWQSTGDQWRDWCAEWCQARCLLGNDRSGHFLFCVWRLACSVWRLRMHARHACRNLENIWCGGSAGMASPSAGRQRRRRRPTAPALGDYPLVIGGDQLVIVGAVMGSLVGW